MSETNLTGASPLGRIKNYEWLGRLCVAIYPDVAKDLLNKYYSPAQRPHTTNIQHVDAYFFRFCLFRGLEHTEHVGCIHTKKGPKNDNRALFIAAMLYLYRPAYYLESGGKIKCTDGLTLAIATTLCIDDRAVAKKMKEVLFWAQKLPAFRSDVDAVVAFLKTQIL